MSTLERAALDNAFGLWKSERMADAKDSDAFEVFSAELILKNAELSDAEIQAGISGGGGDGGVDGFFFFIDRVLVQSDIPATKTCQSVELNIIQATTTPGFDEKKIDKLEKFCRYLLDWEDLTSQKNLRQTAKEHMMLFRNRYLRVNPGKKPRFWEWDTPSPKLPPPPRLWRTDKTD
jgi:hypothetical protein